MSNPYTRTPAPSVDNFKVEFVDGPRVVHSWQGPAVDELDALLQARRQLAEATGRTRWYAAGTTRDVRITGLLG